MFNKQNLFGFQFPRLAAQAAGSQLSLDAPQSPEISTHLLAEGDDSKRTLRTTRRRRTDSSGERKRAEAPKRRRTDRGSSAPQPRPSSSGGGAYRPPSGGGLPLGKLSPKMAMIVIGLLVLFFICSAVFGLFNGSDETGDIAYDYEQTASASVSAESFAPTLPTATPKPFTPPASLSTEGQTWLVMLYQDADDKVLEQDIYVDLNEAERVGSGDRLQIIAQVDRYKGGYRGDGNWTGAKRIYVAKDYDLEIVNSQVIMDLGEVSMADGDTLIDFAVWAIQTFPADKHALIMSDHGMGWPGGWTDSEPPGRSDQSSPLGSVLGDQLYLHELDAALEEIRAQTGLEQFELIGMDACLMGHLEVFEALTPHARYAVASQETEPALGWAYTGFLEALKNNPDMDGADLGRLIVESYIRDDQRIVDEQARADMLGGKSPKGLFGSFAFPSAEQLARQMEDNITLSAIDLSAMPELRASVNELAVSMANIPQQQVARARNYAQSFTSIFGKNVPPSYIDLGNFAQLLQQESGSADVSQAADRVMNALNQAIVAEKHGPKKPGATGVSVYFPNSQLYGSPVTGAESYTIVARRFASNSLWDDFLAYHYTGRPFEAAAGDLAVPDRGAPISAPGTGDITVSPVTLSDNVAAPGKPVLFSADISGENIGYALLFVGFLDEGSNSIFVADTDYLESADTREIGGVYYPDWGEGEFTLEFEWEPLMFAINDGQNSALTLFTPETYGASPDEAVYTVDGIYTYADDGESRSARLYFSNGVLQQVFSFSGQSTSGAPREIIPQIGDTFTVMERWLDLNDGGSVKQVSAQEGATLTFGDETFKWEELDAASGEYIVGFIVQDLDGNATEAYEKVSVE